MKRLFGLIGFTFLFVLSAVFYSDFNEIVFAFFSNIFFNESNIFFSFFYTAFSDPLDMHR